MIRTVLVNPMNGAAARVNGEGELNVVVHPHPPKDEIEAPLPYRTYFANASNSTDMQVASSDDFFVAAEGAEDARDIYIKTVSFVIADASATLNKFGNITALTNGCNLKWVTQDYGTVTIGDSLKTNWDFIRLCAGQPSFGDAAGAFRASNVSSTSEGYIPVLDLSVTFGLQWGVRLRANTTDCLVFEVRDDTTGVDQFDAIAYGIRF